MTIVAATSATLPPVKLGLIRLEESTFETGLDELRMNRDFIYGAMTQMESSREGGEG